MADPGDKLDVGDGPAGLRAGREDIGVPPTDHVVTLLTRTGCHLCAVAEQQLRALRDELGFAYRELDVDASPPLRAEYSDRVPVVLIDNREHGYWRVEEARFRAAVGR